MVMAAKYHSCPDYLLILLSSESDPAGYGTPIKPFIISIQLHKSI